jgi:hypothetical protein
MSFSARFCFIIGLLTLPALAHAQTIKVSGLGPDKVYDRAALEALGTVAITDAREVSGPSGQVRNAVVYTGVELTRLLTDAGIEAVNHRAVRAGTIIATASDGYAASFSWGELFNSAAGRQVLIVIRQDGQLLEPEKGAFTIRTFSDLRPGPRHVRDVIAIAYRP